ncbi:hypothetical protein [Actinoplanes sp. NPDC049316]|uniref:hypothetical protein n=1 Tax=Actinoplanes sp. NPDC049316 TaxID=3154727 RepID=UPI00341F8087
MACRYPYGIFPILDLNGWLTGLVSLARLGRVPTDHRDRLRLGDVSCALDHVRDVIPRRPRWTRPGAAGRGHRLAPSSSVQPTGVITADDKARAVELAALGIPPRRSDQDATASP